MTVFLLLLILVILLFSIRQLVQDNGLRSLRDISFWVILVSFTAILSFMFRHLHT